MDLDFAAFLQIEFGAQVHAAHDLDPLLELANFEVFLWADDDGPETIDFTSLDLDPLLAIVLRPIEFAVVLPVVKIRIELIDVDVESAGNDVSFLNPQDFRDGTRNVTFAEILARVSSSFSDYPTYCDHLLDLQPVEASFPDPSTSISPPHPVVYANRISVGREGVSQ